MGRDPLLSEVLIAIGGLEIREQYLPEGKTPVGIKKYGEYVNGTIRVNPMHDVVDTLVHEAIHYLRPAWSERAVLSKTTRLMKQLGHADIKAIYAAYRMRVDDVDT